MSAESPGSVISGRLLQPPGSGRRDWVGRRAGCHCKRSFAIMTSVPEQSSQRSLRASSRSPRSTDSDTAKGGRKEGQQKSGRQSLQEAKRKGRMEQNRGEGDIASQLSQLDLSTDAVVTGTALVYDERLTEFYCLWDKSFHECPERVTTVMETIRQHGLLQRCVSVETRAASEEELLLVHSPEFLELMKSSESMTEEEMKALSDRFDAVFLHPKSYSCACLAAGAVLQLVDQVMSAQVRNGLAVIRPPGHHAQRDKMSRFCMFNNVAIAANYAKQKHGLERILIVDWDSHHGQGIQYIFEDDPSVLYFSIHQYKHAELWPHLPESNWSAVGKGKGEGFNINIPWNQAGMRDADYITAFLQVLLPVAFEFRPQLVLVAAGYDCAVGDPLGEMAVSPACFAHLTHMLMPLANGNLILAFEGGYNRRATAEGVCASLKILLGNPCPHLLPPFTPSQSALESISATIAAHVKYWKSLQNDALLLSELKTEDAQPSTVEADEVINWSVEQVMRALPAQRTGLVYDEKMKEHYNMWDSCHPEFPQRILMIYNRHVELQLVKRCHPIPSRCATEEELQMCHSTEHISTIKSSVDMKPRDLHRLSNEYNSIYICPKSYECALLATGSTFNVVEAVVTGKVQNGVAIVRPPGHHAEKGAACGFCFFNTVALAARFAQKLSGRKMKVMILDWDVHHGNGTQHMFEDDPSVLYVSLHRYDNGGFFPALEDANYNRVGCGDGEGFNVNVPWNGGRMGDPEYMAALQKVVMPVAYEFAPELVLVSAGFDAARGDPLGGYLVTPECYAHMTHRLLGLAGGKVVVVLEGGYNLTSISESMSMCTRTLLGDALPDMGTLKPPSPGALLSIRNVLKSHRRYWRSLQLNVQEFVKEEAEAPASPSGEVDVPSQASSSVKGQRSPQASPAPAVEDSVEGPLPEGKRELDMTEAETGNSERSACMGEIIKGMESVCLSSFGDENQQKSKEECSTGPPLATYPSPSSIPVGGARQKVKPASGSPESMVTDRKEGRLELLQGESSESKAALVSETAGMKDRTDRGKAAKSDGASTDGTGQAEGKLGEATGWSNPLSSRSISEIFGISPSMEPKTFYAVEPLAWCPHLETVCPVPASGLNVFQACAECGSETENWVCLVCYQVLCGRYVNEHMLMHSVNLGHLLVLSYADLSVWCYGCEAYIHNQVLFEAKNTAHRMKFGEDVPGLH
ncbi:histone deacetylase 6 isoform X2 [Latimeria chalumnae]|uniref:histone deacetylase 6 isoform X2 n=1 Tax=Latimeria chalumnae TaxID=7897 RepID=UPI00313B340F